MSEKDRGCRIVGCDQSDMGNGYCRLHYIRYWRKIKDREGLTAAVLRSRVQHAMVRDHVEGNGRRHLAALKKQTDLPDGVLQSLVEEIQQQLRPMR